jgi:hypothetical protein
VTDYGNALELRVLPDPGDKTHWSCSGRQLADRLGYGLLAVPDHPLDQAQPEGQNAIMTLVSA